MKQHEREYFVSKIRNGIFILKQQGLDLRVFSSKLEDEIELGERYLEAYSEAFEEGVMEEAEMLVWMEEKGLWTQEDEDITKRFESDLERCRIEIYESRYKGDDLVEQIRTYLRKGEEQLRDHAARKTQFTMNTCEGIAGIERARLIVRKNTYLNGELYDFGLINVDTVLTAHNSSFLPEAKIRELVINDPWKLVWYMRDVAGARLFVDHERELTPEQKNIVVWSRMYDSVHESMDSPSDDVLKDHDMLDGWFLIQKKKREKDRSDKEFDVENPKIANAGEVFMVTKNKKAAGRIHDMNDIGSQVTIQEREEKLAKSDGRVLAGEFRDAKLDKQGQSTEMFRDKFRR